MSRSFGTDASATGSPEGQGDPGAPTIRRVPVLEGFERWAESYDRDPNPLLALEERVLEPVLPKLNGKNVIDVACGTGRWLTKLLSCGALSGVGIDVSVEMLARAATKPALRGRLVRGDGLALPFRSDIADLGVCSFAAGYISDLPHLARELARVARRNADLFVTDFHPLGHLRGWRRAVRVVEGAIEIASVAHSIEQITGAFQKEGFKLLQCVEAFLGEPEKRIFDQSGKRHLFAAACEAPAIFVCHFRLAGKTAGEEI